MRPRVPPTDVTYAEGYALTYRVTDVDGDTVTLTFAIRVNGIPSFVREQEDQPYLAGEAVSLELPEAEGGNVARTYRLDGELPAGLSFDPGTRTISGTPPEFAWYTFDGYTVTYRVADVDGEEPTPLVFTIRVDGIPRFDETVSSQVTFAEGQTIDPWVLPSASGGNGDVTYELVGELPEGLSYDGATRTISGTLSADAMYAAESDGYVVTYQVTDQDGDAPAALEFTIVVHGMPSFHAQVVDDQLYPAGEAVSLGLPEAVGGNDDLTYTLEGELPAGLSFDGVARTISGTPPTDATYAESDALTYRVTDVDGDAVTLRFAIRVNGIPSFVREEEDQLYTAGEAVSLELLEAVGGNVARTYRLDGELPAGLSFDPATRTISGTPPEFAWYAFEGYALTYRVADVDGEEPTPLVFTIRVDGIPRFDETVSSQVTFAEGQTIDPWVLPSASGGNGDVTYELVGELPEGLAYDGATRTISGTLSADASYAAESDGYVVTYQVTDQDGDAPEALEFTIVIHGMPSFGAQVVEDQSYEAGGEETLALPEAVGGNGALTYTLEGELPAGLSFDGAARTISGTPPTDATYAESDALTYRVTDIDGDAVTLRFAIAVNGIPSFVREEEDQLYTAGEAVSLELPEAAGGNVARTYRLDGELPEGLVFDPATRTISGTPPEFAWYAFEGYALTYRVADVDGEEPTPLVFTIRVDGIPRFDETVSSQITFAEGQTIDPWVLPSASGGNGQLTYELVGELPEGLSYDGATRTISGTLSADAMYAAESDGYVVTYQVTDQDGDAPAALEFTIVVHGMPSFSGQVVDDQSYEAGGEETLGLPEAVGGNGALTYTLEGELPAGLSFDGTARTISGTPPTDATYAEGYALTYRVADVDGDDTALRFAIRVNGIPSFVREEEDQLYPAGEAVSLELPEAEGGNVARTYRLDGELPEGLVFDPATRTISGTPPEFAWYAFEGYALTYRVADVDGEEPTPLVFTIRVDGIPRFDETVSSQITFAEGQTIDPWVLPSASGGNGQLTYELVGELPEGLSYDGATRTISGTLSADAMYAAESDGYVVTYQVTDQDGDAPAALEFTIVVHGMPSFSGQVVDDQLYPAGDAVSLGLPEAVGGNGALTYTLEGELPAGLSFDGVARTISGTPPTDATYAESDALTYRVTDVDGDAVTLRFAIRVNGIPSFVREEEDQLYPAGEAVSLELPEAEGGNVARTYRLDGELPEGLVFDPATRTISGTPPEFAWYAFEGYALTYRVADVDGEEPTPLVFTIRVDGIPRFDETVSSQITFAEGQTIDPWVLPSASGGNGQLTYELVGELPEGLSYDGATRTISGTLSADAMYAAESDGYVVTYQVTDQDGDAPAALEFTIVVHGMPSFSGQVVDDQLYPAGDAVSLGLPEAVGGNGALTYTLEGELPAGLSFDGAARTISGTPPTDATYAESDALTYRVTDVDGDAVTLRFAIRVNGIPSFVREEEDQLYPAGEAVSLELPEAAGGNVARTYRLDGELPEGLVFDPATRTISGTPPEFAWYAFEGYALTYRVADVDGEEPTPLVFTIRVDGIPRFDETVSSQITFAEGQTIDPWVLPSASGGNGQLTYELVGELPEGLSYDGATRTISGTLSADAMYAAESDGYVVTYQVTDQDGDAPAALEFTIVVHGMPSFSGQVVDDQSYEAGGEETLGLAGGGWWEWRVDVYLGWGVAAGSVV